jgi:WD40 repeat protein
MLVRAVAFSPGGETLAVACGQECPGVPGEVRLYSVDRGKLLATLKGHKEPVNFLSFTPDGRLLLSGGNDNKCVIWDTSARRPVGELNGHPDSITGLSVSPDGKQVATSSGDKAVVLWELSGRRKVATLEAEIGPLAYSPNGRQLAGGGIDGTIRVWDATTRKELARSKGHDDRIVSLAFTPDGRYLATCSRDGKVRLSETRGWTEEWGWQMGSDEPWSLAFSPDGKTLAVGLTGEVVFLNASREVRALPFRGDILRSRVAFRAHDAAVFVAFRSDGKALATGSFDETVKIWTSLPSFTKK